MMVDFYDLCLTLTTGLKYVLYVKDEYDKMLFNAMQTYNKISGKKDYTYTIQEFHNVLSLNNDIVNIIKEIEELSNDDESIQLNSVIFLYTILDTYPNLKKLTFEFSNDDFDRITKDEIGNKEDVFNFQIGITDIVFDASTFFSREMVELINKELIKVGKLSNSYLGRSSYIYLKWKELSDIFAIIGATKVDGQDMEYYAQFVASLTSFFGENADETNVLYITDYTIY
ncbi:MAG: hypothetical protein IKO36_02830 [Bacteroidaceae bacterium]|nr:hypothetical protein [Bacteroidaceae bacterium]